MDDSGFGIYKYYFKLLRTFGAFPYRVEGNAQKVGHYRDGLWKWLYYINYIGTSFGAAFQAVQLALTIQYEPDPINVIAQLCWMFAMGIPFANQVYSLRNEDKIANSVDVWCQLERTVIGSSLRGLGNMPSGPLPTMSACHAAQNRLCKRTSAIYILMGITGFIGMAMHYWFMPKFPAYLYQIIEGEDVTIKYLCGAFQLWMVILIWINIFATEVIMVVASGSLVHCLETLSYRGAVVMANGQCDVPHLNETAFEGKGMTGSGPPSKPQFNTGHTDKAQEKVLSAMNTESRAKADAGGGKGGYDEDSMYLASVVQNVVDIQYALDRYKDVEAVVDSLNNAFSKMVFAHQSIYMMLMCTLFYTPIRHLKILPVEGSTLFAIIALYYCIRLFVFFPAMGRLNAQSHTFVESWMEGLRHIPRGKYAYEFYMHKLESCRKLAFDSGGFYLMQKGTVLTFVSIVTTHIIVLLQLY
ncbi:uncharacterized protein LOC110848329 isoform X2 [Folsomia candida]|uniref:uncharacterized protein LOC110848329 isoform X2 n=1 Tax=Folsomia candida TaxID=158441 RepID=UPI001604D3B3|nr:uncharacterized protein LOC110848329 isoform X2 [Folsomia candida]